MGVDDGTCDVAVDGIHRWEVDEVAAAGRGVAVVNGCVLCGAVDYEASAGDDPRRPLLD